jgi:preprotein translocase subunit YajC
LLFIHFFFDVWRCSLFESTAFAMGPMPQNGAAPGGTDMLMQFLPLILMFVIFWFLLIRPQQKRAKSHKQMLAELKRGDRVQTGSGLIGRIMEIDEEQVLLECGESKLRMSRGAIAGLLADGKADRDGKTDKGGKSGKSGKQAAATGKDDEPDSPATDASKAVTAEKTQNT